jgi:hypothetical protein
MDSMEKDNPYANVPHRGKHFTEGGKTYYWSFSSVKPGTRFAGKQRAYRSIGQPTIVSTEDLQEHPLFPGSTPVTPILVENLGFYYDIDTNVVAVENRTIAEGCITKWRIDQLLSGSEQQELAWSCKDANEYEHCKNQKMTKLEAANYTPLPGL